MSHSCFCQNDSLPSTLSKCNNCGKRTHLMCLGLDENRFKLNKVYYCSSCQKEGFLPVWDAKCRLEWCSRAATEKLKYKFCSKDHEEQFFNDNADKIYGMTRQQLGAVLARAGTLEQFREFVFNLNHPEMTKPQVSDPTAENMLAQLEKTAEAREKKMCGFNDKLTGGEDNPCTKDANRCKQHSHWLQILRGHYEFEADLHQQLGSKRLWEEREREKNLANAEAIMDMYPSRRN